MVILLFKIAESDDFLLPMFTFERILSVASLSVGWFFSRRQIILQRSLNSAVTTKLCELNVVGFKSE